MHAFLLVKLYLQNATSFEIYAKEPTYPPTFGDSPFSSCIYFVAVSFAYNKSNL